jgi:signal peptidase II
MQRSKAALFWPVLLSIAAADFITKKVALQILHSTASRPISGDWLRLNLVRNSGAAFGLNVGPYSRWVFMGLTIVALVILARLYRATRAVDLRRVL